MTILPRLKFESPLIQNAGMSAVAETKETVTRLPERQKIG
jgi:hypothetical protein